MLSTGQSTAGHLVYSPFLSFWRTKAWPWFNVSSHYLQQPGLFFFFFFCLASLKLAAKLWDLNVRCQIKPDVHHVNQHRKQYVFTLKAFVDCKHFIRKCIGVILLLTSCSSGCILLYFSFILVHFILLSNKWEWTLLILFIWFLPLLQAGFVYSSVFNCLNNLNLDSVLLFSCCSLHYELLCVQPTLNLPCRSGNKGDFKDTQQFLSSC